MEQEKMELARISTGVAGLDAVLHGGLLRHNIYLAQGHPGAGKTTLGLQFLLAGRDRGETCLFISLSENDADLDMAADAHGWSLDGIARRDLSVTADMLNQDAQYTIFHPTEIELNETTQAILAALEEVKPDLVVFDGMSELRLLAREPLRFRRQLLALKQFMVDRNITALLLDDRSSPTDGLQPESLVSGNILLEEHTPEYGAARRRLRVTKYRGSDFHGGFHDYTITQSGLIAFPRLVAADHFDAFVPQQYSSGLATLDAMMGGGLDRGTTTLLMGPAGSGKSTVAMQYVAAALGRGDHAAVYTFDETLHTLRNRTLALCRPDISPYLENGALRLQQVDPAELSPGAFAHQVRQAAERDGVRVIVIDSLNGYLTAMPEEHFLAMHLHELFAYLNQRGVVTIVVCAQHGLLGAMQNPIDVSYLADSVIVTRYYEAAGEVKQALSVFKKRSGQHERTLRAMQMVDGYLEIGEPLRQYHGVLTGVPSTLLTAQEANGAEFSSGATPQSIPQVRPLA